MCCPSPGNCLCAPPGLPLCTLPSDGGSVEDASPAMVDASLPTGATPCTDSAPCTAPAVCNMLPGTTTGYCGAACQSNADCPAWLTCSGGTCSQCTTCPAGQSCSPVTTAFPFLPGPPGLGGGQCTSSSACSDGEYCSNGQSGGGSCQAYEACQDCAGGNCNTASGG